MPRKKMDKQVEKVEQVETVKPSSMKTKIGIAIVLLVILAIFLFMKGFIVAATVNNQPIFRWSLIQTLEKQGGKRALDSLVNQTLIIQEAQKKKINISDTEVDREIKTIDEDLKKQGQDLNTALASQGMALADLKEQIKLQKTVEKLLAEKTKVTEAEVKDFTDKNKTDPQTARQQLSQQKIATEYTAWIESLRQNAKVNYFLQF